MNNLNNLKNALKDKIWFYDTGIDEYDRPVVYVHLMNSSIFKELSEVSKQFLETSPCIHYASSSLLERSKYVNEINLIKNLPNSIYTLDFLFHELNKLKDVCGLNILSDIFYEVHDGQNAITNLSAKFPEVKDSLDKLYAEYGFDLIYNYLED